MSPAPPARRSTEKRPPDGAYFSAPAKAFLLGEYAVLGGLPAVVATFGPRFGLRSRKDSGVIEFHPESPAGILLSRVKDPQEKPEGFLFEDPFAGAGGFGASTAEFALVYLALAQRAGLGSESEAAREWFAAWEAYREVTSRLPLAPSGADLVAQWRGGVCALDPRGEYFRHSEGDPVCADLWDAFDWSSLLVFSATRQPGRKVATHEHLKTLSRLGIVSIDRASEFPEMQGFFAGLREPLFHGLDAIRANDPAGLGRALSAYAEELARLGLEAQGTAADRAELGKMKGVLGVKGSGAMQADSVLVLMPPVQGDGHPRERAERRALIEAAQARGLVLVTDGLSFQAGASAHH